MWSRYSGKVQRPEKKVNNSLMCLRSEFPRDRAEPGFLFTSFIEDTLSEKRSKEAGQEDGEKPRKNVASGETTAPNVSSREARGLTWRTPGHQH